MSLDVPTRMRRSMFFCAAVQADDSRHGVTEDADDNRIGSEARKTIRVPKASQTS